MRRVTVFIISIVLLFCCIGEFVYADDYSDINEIISSLESLEEAGKLNSKEGYNLVYLAKDFMLHNTCSDEQVEAINHFSLEYAKQKALASIYSSVDISLKLFTTKGGDCRYYDESSWKELEQLFHKAIEAVNEETSEETIPLIEKDFFEKAQALPDAATIKREFSKKITSELVRADNALLEQVNLSLTKRNLLQTDFPYEYQFSADNEEYKEKLVQLINNGYNTENGTKILELHEALINDLIELGLHASTEEMEKLTDSFISNLSEVEYITADATPYILDNLKQSLLQRLSALVDSKEIQELSFSKRKKIKTLYDSTRSNIEKAETIEEAQNALSLGEENILKIAAINDAWIPGAMLIGIIISMLLSAIAILWYNKEKNAGRIKYKLLMEEERERIDKATICDELPCNEQE